MSQLGCSRMAPYRSHHNRHTATAALKAALRRVGKGAPGGGHYGDVTGRGAGYDASDAAPCLEYGSDRRNAGQAAPRLRRHMRCGPGSREGQRAAAQKCDRGVKCEVERVLLHRSRATWPWVSRSGCYHFRTASPLLALCWWLRGW